MYAGDRRYFRDLLRTGQPVVGDPVQARTDSTLWTVTFAQPVRDDAGAVRAALLGTVHLTSFARTFAQAELPAGAVATLVDANGIVLGRSGDARRWIGRPLHTAVHRRHSAAQEGVVEMTDAQGVRQLIAHTHLPHLDWHIYVSLPSRAALAGVDRELRRDVLLALATLVVSLALAVAVGRRLVRPLEALAADAQSLSAGDVPTRVLDDAPGELGTLADAFHEMAATIAARTAASFTARNW